MASLNHLAVHLLVAFGLFVISYAGPLGPLPTSNVTSLDLGFKEDGCTVGDVVYGADEEVPGGGPCERCRCAGAAVRCERPRCEPRPGCKALHRPDHCCPTYQCECEQEGRVYGNGEKLVDPLDPCRVCYCQGGEVVCRRIACFVRDDCSPRLVPGRCCPEYENCPLRGVTTVPGVTPAVSTAVDETPSSAAPTPKQNIKQEITIKEITPVSEIPVISDVKVKEILPSPAIEVPDYSSSKSPLIVREATTENILNVNNESKNETPAIIEMQSSSSTAADTSILSIKSSEISETKTNNDSLPSKISLSTQDSINSDIYPSSFATMGSPSIVPDVVVTTATTKAPIVEEEDPALFDHNPAFPPIPDDLSVIGTHEDEILPEQTAETEHMESNHQSSAPTVQSATETTHREVFTASVAKTSETTPAAETTFSAIEKSSVHDIVGDSDASSSSAVAEPNSKSESSSTSVEPTEGIQTTEIKDSPMLNLRSAIPTEILNVPSFVPEEINGEPDDTTESTTAISKSAFTTSTTEKANQLEAETAVQSKTIEAVSKPPKLAVSESRDTPVIVSKSSELPTKVPSVISSSTEILTAISSNPVTSNIIVKTEPDTTVDAKATKNMMTLETTTTSEGTTLTSEPTKIESEAKAGIVTEITAQTEFSSLPIETSDQNPQDNPELIEKELVATVDPLPADLTTTKISTPIESEIITVSRVAPLNVDNQSFDNLETTEFLLTPLGSSETSTDVVEQIKISADSGQNAAIIESSATKKNNVLTDLINLVGDVASIGEHTESPREPAAISDSEELIPVNAGYKSKNNNWNLNSITEIPIKSKSSPSGNKQKIVEIEGEDSDSITDSPPPNDNVEPTTRRPIIDNVSDDVLTNNSTDKKDIEIITKSYVPTISRRPTKVVMKKSNERVVTEQNTVTASDEPSTAPVEFVTTASETSTSEPSTASGPASSAASSAASGARHGSNSSAPPTAAPTAGDEPSTADPLH